MDHYLLTARTVTHAQQMAQTLERAGVFVKIRRVGNGVTKSGCGDTLQIAARDYQRAAEALRAAGQRPVKVFHVVNGVSHEVVMA